MDIRRPLAEETIRPIVCWAGVTGLVGVALILGGCELDGFGGLSPETARSIGVAGAEAAADAAAANEDAPEWLAPLLTAGAAILGRASAGRPIHPKHPADRPPGS